MDPSSPAPPRGLIVFGVMLGLFLGAMESTAVATAMPTVVATLGGLAVYSWVFSGYILAATISMPLWGKAADLYGRRAAYLTGLGIFLGGSVLSGLATSMTGLIVFRTIQGAGGGALIPLGHTILADIFGLERRAKMQGYFSATWGSPRSSGRSSAASSPITPPGAGSSSSTCRWPRSSWPSPSGGSPRAATRRRPAASTGGAPSSRPSVSVPWFTV